MSRLMVRGPHLSWRLRPKGGFDLDDLIEVGGLGGIVKGYGLGLIVGGRVF